MKSKLLFTIALAFVGLSANAQCVVTAGPNTTICTGDSAQLNAIASNGLAPYSYFWSPPNDLNNPNLQNPTTGTVLTTNYTVFMTDANGCTANASTTVYVSTVPSASFCPFLISGNTVSFCSNVSSNTLSCYWDFGDGNNATTYPPNQDATHTYASVGNYNVCLMVFNPPCADTICQSTVVGVSEYYLSSLINISPNPSNGIFLIKSDIKISTMKITNLLGEKVYESGEGQGTGGGGNSQLTNHPITIDLFEKPNGIYFLTIKTEQGTATKKLIINK